MRGAATKAISDIVEERQQSRYAHRPENHGVSSPAAAAPYSCRGRLFDFGFRIADFGL